MKIDEKTRKDLLNKAKKAQRMAYVPYSKFPVGAALLTRSGETYLGCNIENASYGATNCAERTAIFKAISEGEKDFIALAVVGNDPDFTFPCGICRQVIHEFAKDIEIIFENNQGQILPLTMKDLFPHPFGEDSLDKTKEEKKK